jgi:hypothetical protein
MALQAGSITALKSPLVQPLTLTSPLNEPMSRMEYAYVETPTQIQARSVPFVDEYGDTIIAETIIYGRPNHDPMIFDVKQQVEPPPITYTHKIYSPIVLQGWRAPLSLRLFVLAFRPTSVMSYTPPSASYIQSLTQRTLDDIQLASTWHGYANPANVASLQYTLLISGFVVVDTFPPTRTVNGYFDLDAIYQNYDICNQVRSGNIDEVWIWADGGTPADIANPRRPYHPRYAPSEFAINGPLYKYHALDFQTPDCDKTVLTLFLNFDTLHPENAVESYAHTWEYAMAAGYPLTDVTQNPFGYQQCDWGITTDYSAYYTAGRPKAYCTGVYTPTNARAFAMRAAPESNYIAVCGDVHQALNTPMFITQTTWPTRTDWYYPDLTNTVQTRCMDWQYSGGTVSNANRDTWGNGCTDWECYHRKWLIWWMQNIPGLGNTNTGRTGAYRPDWWAIKIRPEIYKP